MRSRDTRASGCETCWIGWSTLLLGGASVAVTGFEDLTLASIVTRLGIAALTGFVLSWIFCPARSAQDGPGAGGSDGGEGGGAGDAHDAGDGDGGGDGGE